jgi:hypothetical protein
MYDCEFQALLGAHICLSIHLRAKCLNPYPVREYLGNHLVALTRRIKAARANDGKVGRAQERPQARGKSPDGRGQFGHCPDFFTALRLRLA